MLKLTADLIDSLIEEARSSPRLRKNLNVHNDYADPCQRLLNALEPESYVRPHRHLTPLKPETFVVLRGAFLLLIYDDHGEVLEHSVLRAGGEVLGADVPAGAWHSIVALESGSVFFEAKPGPYEPVSDKDWAPWAPAEESPEAADWLIALQRRVLGRHHA